MANKQPINPTLPVTERWDLRSGVIKKEGIGNEFGIAFLTTNDQNDKTAGWTPEQLLDNYLRNANPDVDIPEEDRFFKIVGGYLYERDFPGGVKTSKVTQIFGVAADPAMGFNLVEEGSTIVGDEWSVKYEPQDGTTLKPGAESFLDELNLANEGWTLILDATNKDTPDNPDFLFPRSGKPVELFEDACPDLKSTLTKGTLTPTHQPVSIQVEIEGLPDSGEIDWGDGSTPTPIPITEDSTIVDIPHNYIRERGKVDQNHTIMVTITGPGDCLSTKKHQCKVNGRGCPEVSCIVEEGELTQAELPVTLTVNITKEFPDAGEVDWGDGTKEPFPAISDIDTTLTFEHRYARDKDGELEQIIKVTTNGPGEEECDTSNEHKVIVPPVECPIITVTTREDLGDTHLVVFLKLDIDGDLPDECKVDWGEGPIEDIPKDGSEISHEYPRPIGGDDGSYEIKVNTTGPLECKFEQIITDKIPKIPCPTLMLDVVKGEATEEKLPVTATIKITGPHPENGLINWGDGNQDDLSERLKTEKVIVISHEYDRPRGDGLITHEIRVETSGPGDCTATALFSCDNEGPGCPSITLNQRKETTASHVKVFVSLDIVGQAPDTCTVNWGNQNTEAIPKDRSEVSHEYQRPVGGQSETYTISVLTVGPGDTCGFNDEFEVEVPKGDCPIVALSADLGTATENKQLVTATITVTGPNPTSGTIDWGDSTVVDISAELQSQTSFTKTHEYVRPPGADSIKQLIKVNASGPGDCTNTPSKEIQIEGPGCPVFELDTALGEATETIQPVSLTISLSGPNPDKVSVDWGDNTGIQDLSTLKTPNSVTVTHDYARPGGEGTTSHTIKVAASGPGSCEATIETNCPITGPGCPVISILPRFGVASETEQPVMVEVKVVGPNPDSAVIDWGIGPKLPVAEISTTDEFVLEHVYPRPKGEGAETYTITLETTGPGDCNASPSKQISIQGPGCGILSLDADLGTTTETTQEVILAVSLEGPNPGSASIDWGDSQSTPIDLSNQDQVIVSHNYVRPVGDETIVREIVVTGSGPGECSIRAETSCPISGPGCPVISILPTFGETTETKQEVLVEVRVLGQNPNSASINWGDNTVEDVPQITSEDTLVLNHEYTRPQGSEISTPTITLTTDGPGQCQANPSKEISIPGPGCPVLTLAAALGEATDTTQVVVLTIELEGPTPNEVNIDWGDQQSQPVSFSNQNTIRVDHTYQRPVGNQTIERDIIVNASGPGACDTRVETRSRLTGPGCPVISILPSFVEATETEQPVSVEVNVLGPNPDSAEIDWGDNTVQNVPQISSEDTFTLTHIYTRPVANLIDKPTITLSTSGPGDCVANPSKQISIQGPGCGILSLDAELGEATETTQIVRLTVSVEGPNPTNTVISWGDGDTDPIDLSTQDAVTIEHSYARPDGDQTVNRKILVSATGPGECLSSVETSCPLTGPGCPMITISPVFEEASETEQPVTLTIKVVGPNPDTAEIDWGDNTKDPIPTISTENEIVLRHVYARPLGDAIDQPTITLTTNGPGNCNAEPSKQINIYGPGCGVLSLDTSLGDTSETNQVVILTVSVDGPNPTETMVDWGDQQIEPIDLQSQDSITISHNYERPKGDGAIVREIIVTAKGPGECLSSVETSCPLRGPGCPVISISPSFGDATATEQVVNLEVEVVGQNPDGGEIDWGDNKKTSVPQIATESNFTVSHTYTRPEGNGMIRPIIQLDTSGPGDCVATPSKQIIIEGPGCGVLSLDTALGDTSESSQVVLLTVSVDGPIPTSTTVDWGDTHIDSVNFGNQHSVTLSHTYDRPRGEETILREILVSASGPGECASTVETSCPLTGPGCPRISIEPSFDIPTDTRQPVVVQIQVHGQNPDNAEIDWGDGVKEMVPRIANEDDFELTHEYDRPDGDGVSRPTITLTTSGPGQCVATPSKQISIQGPGCPILTLDSALGETTELTQAIILTVSVEGPIPDSAEIDWGDSQTEPIDFSSHSSVTKEHIYQRPKGEGSELKEITVTATGPGSCTSIAETSCPLTGPGCPVVSIAPAFDVASETEQPVTLTVKVHGVNPDSAVIDWGDETVEPVPKINSEDTFELQHFYKRPIGQAFTTPTIQLTTTGPGDCSANPSKQIRIDGPGCGMFVLDTTLGETTETKQAVSLTVSVFGPNPAQTTVNWGDNHEEPLDFGGGKTATIQHEYDRPLGEGSVLRTIVVAGTGPGDCSTSAETSCPLIGPGCPIISISPAFGLATETEQPVALTVKVYGPNPQSAEIDWGDDKIEPVGQIKSEKEFQLEHIYARPVGDEVKTPTIILTTTGPGECNAAPSKQIRIPGPGCGIISLDVDLGETTETTQEFILTASVYGPNPTETIIDWGDDKTDPIDLQSSDTATINHVYTRPAGDGTANPKIVLTAKGPGACESIVETNCPLTGPGCPWITMSPIFDTPSESEQPVKLTIKVMGPNPDSAEIDWGDGNKVPVPDIISEEEIVVEHIYGRPAGDGVETYDIKLVTTGPGDCTAEISKEVRIDGPGCPVISLGMSLGEPSLEQQPVILKITVNGPNPQSAEIDWGDGNSEPVPNIDSEDEIELTHEYARPAVNAEETHVIILKATGPGECSVEPSCDVRIVGPGCPVLVLETETEGPGETHQKVNVKVSMIGVLPDDAVPTIDWGDGNTEEITGLSASTPAVLSHEYDRSAVENETGPALNDDLSSANCQVYSIKVSIDDCGDCDTEVSCSVIIQGLCPTIKVAKVKELELNEAHREVEVVLEVSGGEPTEYCWYWEGDLSIDPEITTEPKATHCYERPLGEDICKTFIVLAKGPGKCKRFATGQIEVSGICPEIVLLTSTFLDSDEGKQVVKVEAIVDNIAADPATAKFIWDWGDGTTGEGMPGETSATHEYSLQTEEVSYPVWLTIEGPGTCRTAACISILIPDLCTEVLSIKPNYGIENDAELQVKFFLKEQKNGLDPETYIWDFGDGSPIVHTKVPYVDHTFKKSEDGSNKTVVVKATAEGPAVEDSEPCKSCESTKSITLIIPGATPLVVGLKTIYGHADEDGQWLSIYATVKGERPLKYIWDWGDGSDEEITYEPKASHKYENEVEKDFSVELTVIGAGNEFTGEGSESSFSTNITIKQLEHGLTV